MMGSINTFRWTKKLAVSSTHACASRRNAEPIGDAIIQLLQPFIDLLHTITGNKGDEFADHERIDKDRIIDFFCCLPLFRSGAGADETLNGLVRQDIHKDLDVAALTDQELKILMDMLNHHQRKCLDYQTHIKVFFEQSIVAIFS